MRPRTERDHHVAGIDRPGSGFDAPIRIGAMQRAGVARQRKAAERGKARGIGARQRQRIADAHRAGPMHRVPEHSRQRRLERKRAVAIERHVGDAEARGKVELRR